ncbi:MAG: xanthine dehydrogenase accessory protein XdhC [Gammaproteobacteria bacterium]
MSDWLNALQETARRGAASVLVTVAATQGSTPREAGAKMVVMQDAAFGTIGGGRLEFKAIEIARAALAASSPMPATLRRFPLGPSLGQCCGGVAVLAFEWVPAELPNWAARLMEWRRRNLPAVRVGAAEGPGTDAKLVVTAEEYHGSLGDDRSTQAALASARALLASGGATQLQRINEQLLLFDSLRAADFHIVLFGAGHVGTALVDLLSGLPACAIRWIDSRDHVFPATLPANVQAIASDASQYEVDHAPPGSYFLVMTHSHPLDQAICERILRRRDYRYFGLIGSASKRRQFEKRLRLRGIADEALAEMICPIGVEGISGKHPLEIAIAVAAELLQVRARISTPFCVAVRE